MSNQFHNSRKLAELKRTYFSDDSRQLLIRKGEILLHENELNSRLYLVVDGTLTCYLKDEDGKDYKVMESSRNMFLGVYSFFSEEHKSYLTVIASEDTNLVYLDRTDLLVTSEKFANDFLPVIVNEIYQRQVLTQQLNRERQAAIKKLYDSEKMILLGQLAAGLAHELNNAVGILERNTEWLIDELKQFLKQRNLLNIFLPALEGGQQQSTIQIRERRDLLERQFGIPTQIAKQLAKTSLSMEEIGRLIKSNMHKFDSINQITESGIVLHDMRIAAHHATHVVRSVRDLGSHPNTQPVPTSILETIGKALTLTGNLTRNVQVHFEKQQDGIVLANPGDLVQVWVNLIKNACESLNQAGTAQPQLWLEVTESEGSFVVAISDNGGGISPEVMARIFEPNFTTKVNGLSFGLGLGLSIVKKIITGYRGTIHFSSAPTKTTCIVQLPKT